MSTRGHDQATNVLADKLDSTLRVHAVVIEVTKGPDAGQRVRVDQPAFIVGTGPTAHLRLSDDTVSREHLRIQLTPGGLRLVDAGSTNGTWLGAIRVTDCLLAASAAVVVGSTTLMLTIEAATLELPLSTSATFGRAIGVSPAMRHLFLTLERASRSDVTILLEGESGVGKEVLAHAVHESSPRANGPFVAVDCGAIPASLIESELFGHERGAFTGADRAREGVFEQAHGGTLFLDEIGELPLDLQPKLLRALETREIRRVGGRSSTHVDVRVVAATNRNLADAAARNEFRRDVYYRLAVVRVNVPPLRDRPEDILPLARTLLHRVRGFEDAELPPELSTMLLSYPWPGNVRELRNVIERYTVLGGNAAGMFDANLRISAPKGDLSHLPYHEARRVTLDEFEKAYVPAVLERADGVVARAALLAQVGRGSFHRMLARIRGGAATDDE